MKIEANKVKPLIYIAIALIGFYVVFNLKQNANARGGNTKSEQTNKDKRPVKNVLPEKSKNQKKQNKKTNNKNNPAEKSDSKKGQENKQASSGSDNFKERYEQAGSREQDAIDRKSGSFGFIQITFILLIIGGLAYLIYKYIAKKKEAFSDSSEYINVLSTTPLAANKHLQVVQIFDNIFILGVGDNSVNLITQVTDKNLIDQIREDAKNKLPSITFKEQISKLLNKFNIGSSSSNDPEEEAISFFKEQREKINGLKNKNGNGNNLTKDKL